MDSNELDDTDNVGIYMFYFHSVSLRAGRNVVISFDLEILAFYIKLQTAITFFATM